MEDNHQTVIVGIAQDGFIQAHGFLFVASEEVHLDTLYTQLVHPAHHFLALNRVVHFMNRSLLDIIPIAA